MSTRQHHDEQDHDVVPAWDRPAPADRASPGKRSMTQGLAPRPLVFRVESAEAARELGAAFGHRDRNGVAETADAAVDRAATSSGSALRADVRERFESSLGADLSAVRVHTGDASAHASTAVGAKAYTVGNDIHFGAGQYQPDDPFGLHLLAHEVAHTQQQAGGTPHRQHKLEVSTPGDALEREADAAADAMVAGQPASLGAGGGLARKENNATPEKKGQPFEGTFSLKKGPFALEFTASSDGKFSVAGSASIGASVPTAIPGIFVEGEVGLKVKGEGQLNADGSGEGAAGVEGSGQVTLNGGIPEVASVYGGGGVTVKWEGLKVTRSAQGKWNAEVSGDIALACNAVVGAKVEALDKIKDTLPKGWGADYKWEYKPGGEVELLVFNVGTGKFRRGKDLDAIMRKLDAALKALEPVSDRAADAAGKARKVAAAHAEMAAVHEKARQMGQNAQDRADYNAAHNPNAQSIDDPLLQEQNELNSCEAPE